MAAVPLRFKKDGSFKIMQITDTQEIPAVNPDTLKLMNQALEQEKPDLVVFTGDQIKGYGVTFKGDSHAKVKRTIATLLEPVVERGIPFAVTFGNHDDQAGVTKEEQWEHYKTYPLCLGEDAEEADGCGTFHLPVLAGDSDKTVLNIYMIDSHGDQKGGGYQPVDASQLEWYRRTRDKLKDQNEGQYVPSMVFQHIPCHEYYNVLRQVKKGTKHAVRAFRTHKNEYYLLDESKCAPGGIFKEPPSIPDIDTGEFKALSEKGDVFAVFAGHDHNNSFVGTHEGIDLGYTQGCGFNVYGPGPERGVRVFELKEENPRAYTSRTITFRTLFGTKVSKPFKEFIYVNAPTTVDMAIPMILKALLLLTGSITVIILLAKLL